MEVTYLGIRQTAQHIVEVALQEDVDVIGLSSHTGTHNEDFPELLELLNQQDCSNVMVIGGGVIPQEDRASLEQQGVKRIFGPGSSIVAISDFIRQNLGPAG